MAKAIDLDTTILTGTVGRDAEERQIGSSMYIVTVIAVTKQGDKTEWVGVNYYIKGACSPLTQFLKKGTKIAVQGNCVADTYEYQGKVQAQRKIWAQSIHLLSRKMEGGEQ